MCTLLILHKVVPGYPVVVAANRDEYRDRNSAPPSFWDGNPGFFAGKDLKEGGTWLGLNSAGLLIGLLNRRSEKGRDSSRRSRGLLCTDALKHSRLSSLRKVMEKPLSNIYNPFNLFYTDGDKAYVTCCQDDQWTVEVGSGFHVLANGDLDDAGHARVKKVFDLAEGKAPGSIEEALVLLKSLCRRHAQNKESLDSVCIHGKSYGTVSSSIVALSPRVSETLFFHAEGNPCQTEYKELSPISFIKRA